METAIKWITTATMLQIDISIKWAFAVLVMLILSLTTITEWMQFVSALIALVMAIVGMYKTLKRKR